MRTVIVEHRKLILDSAYRTKMRPIVTRARNWRGRANDVRVTVLHEGDCCETQPYAETERIIWPQAAR